jgi:hypothetical protein
MSLFSLVLQYIHPQTIVFRMILQAIQRHATVQPGSAVHPSPNYCVQNDSTGYPDSCHCSAWFCSTSIPKLLCSECFYRLSRFMLLFSLVLQYIHPQTIVFRMILQAIQIHATVQPGSAVHPSSNYCVQNDSTGYPASCHCSAWFCSTSILKLLCSEWFYRLSSFIPLFSLVLQYIHPYFFVVRLGTAATILSQSADQLITYP